MKNLKRRLSLYLAVGLSLLVSTTAFAEVKDKPVVDIKLLSSPQRTVYDVGEDVDLYGMKVQVTFNDGEIYTASYTDLVVEGYNSQQEGSQLILARYGNYTVPFSVMVKKGTLQSINAKLKETRVWVEGAKLTPDMFKVTATLDTGTEREISGFEISPDVLQKGRNILTITYQGRTSTVTIDARENSVQSVRIESPGKEEFNYNEPFTTKGLHVVAHYLDGSEKDVTAECKVSGINTGQKGLQYANVEYAGKIVTYKVNVVQLVFDRIDTSPYKEDGVVYVYFKEREEPYVVTKDLIYIEDDNTTGMRTYKVFLNGTTYKCTEEIPDEDKVYRGSREVLVGVPIGINIKTDDVGQLGYIPATEVQSRTEASVRIHVESYEEIPYIQGLPATITVGKNGTVEMPMHMVRDFISTQRSVQFKRFKVKVEVGK